MAIDQKVAVGSVFVLADASFSYRRIREQGNSLREVVANFERCIRRDDSLVVIGVKRRPMSIDRDLEAATVQIGQRINQIVKIDPRRQPVRLETIVSRRNAEEEDLLATHVNQFAEQVGKEFREPWTTGKHEVVRSDLFSADRPNSSASNRDSFL